MTSVDPKTKTSREKIFRLRNSLLIDIFENGHTHKLYNVYIIVFTCLFFQNVVKQYVKTGSVNFGLETIRTGFVKFDKAVLLWLCCFLTTCLTYLFFQIWAQLRTFNKKLTKTWDWFWAVSVALYYFYTVKITSIAITYTEFNPPCAVFVSVESIRLLMKVHSFLRNKAPAVLQSTEASTVVKFSNFFYFLFAPTLIYRDNYPRTKTINWKFVTHRLLECISVLFMFSFIMEAIYPPPDWWAKCTGSELVIFIIEKIPYGGLVLAGSFLLSLHSVQNLFAEITRFGDRLFYLDWWNEYNFSSWMAKWNLLVRDWLYYYVYRDFKQYIYDSTFFGIFSVFLVSFATHEYVMFCWLGKIFPCFLFTAVLIVFPSFYFKCPQNIFFNVLLWCSGCLMMSAFMILYTIEHYALRNAPLKDPTLLELIIPRFVTCDCIFK